MQKQQYEIIFARTVKEIDVMIKETYCDDARSGVLSGTSCFEVVEKEQKTMTAWDAFRPARPMKM